ncbi:hypothetical protein [Rubrivivax albus]|uniref:hypothetical protein n=1 Tax=Rubrivivax albus TaxID=2499835 RepID=UPI0013051FDD|nr:hypothetical protein [Rubrivivax albus]
MSQDTLPASTRPLPFRLWPSARTLTGFALLAWLISLGLNGFVDVNQRAYSGAHVLAIGWLGPLMVNFAWYANLFFLISVALLLGKRSAVWSSLLAAALPLQTITFVKVPLNEAGGAVGVFGLGWGFVVWYSATLLLVAAAGTRQIELHADRRAPSAEMRQWGLALCLGFILFAGALALHDRLRANTADGERLRQVAFKRGAVCNIEQPRAGESTALGDGPLEVRTLDGSSRLAYPFNDVRDLLNWGIPTVRAAGRDYSFAFAGDELVLTSVPAVGPPAATLVVDPGTPQNKYAITVSLETGQPGDEPFRFTWTKDRGYGNGYCPDYATLPRPGEQPREMLEQALALGPQASRAAVFNTRHEQEMKRRNDESKGPVMATFLGESGVPRSEPSLDVPGQSGRLQALALALARAEAMRLERTRRMNVGCPEGTGWLSSWQKVPYAGSLDIDAGVPFMVDERAFYLKRSLPVKAVCVGESVFTYHEVAGDREGNRRLAIDKRALADFRYLGAVTIVLPKPVLTPGADFRLTAIEEHDEGMSALLELEKTGQVIAFRAPLNFKR